MPPLDDLARGFRNRSLVTARLATRVGVSMAKRTFLGASEDRPVDPEQARAVARELVQELGALKGLGLGLAGIAFAAVPVAAAWTALGFFLGSRMKRWTPDDAAPSAGSPQSQRAS